MAGPLDLDIDTHWIRRAAGSMQEATRTFMTAAGYQCRTPVPSGGLGSSDAAAAVVGLVNTRNSQAYEAAAQLQAVTGAIGRQLAEAAGHLDGVEATIAAGIR